MTAIEKGKSEARLAYAGDLVGLAERGLLRRPAHLRRCAAGEQPGAGGDLRPRAGGPQGARPDPRPGARQRHPVRPDRRHLFSRSPANIARVKREFRVGNLYINRKITGALVDRQPFGGFKLSGIGTKAGGPDYLLQFVLPRTITENTLRRGFAPDTEDVAGR